uniref:Uncharacterized protein n=1 Tax=Ditylenchus dipsaci TaxID=166011 RepID=A0A915DBF2_9BILA
MWSKNKSDSLVWDDEEYELDPRFEDPCLEESSKFMDQMLQASVSNYGTTKKAIESIFDCAEDSLRTGPSDVDFGLSLEGTDDLKFTSGYYTGSSRRHKERSSVLSNEGNPKKPASQ